MTNEEMKNYNRILPTTVVGDEESLHKLNYEEVLIDSDPLNGEVYKQASSKRNGVWTDMYSLGKVAIERISSAAGILFPPDGCERTRISSEVGMVTVVGVVKRLDGTEIGVPGTKEVDAHILSEQHRLKLEEKAEAGNLRQKVYNKNSDGYTWRNYPAGEPETDRYIDRRVREYWLDKCVHKMANAETGARLRTIRSILALKTLWTLEELEKPFLVPHISLDISKLDDDSRKKLITKALQSTDTLYGLDESNGTTHEVIESEETATAPATASATAEEEIEPSNGKAEVQAPAQAEAQATDTQDAQDAREKELQKLTTFRLKKIAVKLGELKGKKITAEAFGKKAKDDQIKNILWLENQPDAVTA